MKQVAATLTSVLENPAMELIRNRKTSVLKLAEEQIAAWSLDLYTRNPGPAVRDGEFVGTDLDMATFLTALGNRGAVISLPKEYQKMRAATNRENERVIANENRHGRITGLWSNKEVFSFGVRITDANVVTTDPTTGRETVGAPRNFSLVGIEGDWHTGWSPLEFSPTAKENDFLNDKSLWTDDTYVYFKNFVHPNRWISLYGQYYLIGKALIQRLDEEAKFLDGEVKRLIQAGVTFPQGKGAMTTPYRKTTKTGDDETKIVQAFQVEVDVPMLEETYTYKEKTPTDLAAASDTRRNIIYNIKPRLQFALRSVELAFVQNGFFDPEHTHHKMPAWLKNAKWEPYVPPGKRSTWNRLVLFQPSVGQQGVAIRYRFYDKTEHVAPPEPE